ncbi:MAG: hypothetical protein HOV81_00490 [Kofleriaceae bacterium]|nr:hypothetical protein [Kofleriaceae bacterium]
MTPRGVYVVFQRIGDDEWKVIAEVPRPPGLPAKRGRAAAIRIALGREPEPGESFAALQRSEWRNAQDV